MNNMERSDGIKVVFYLIIWVLVGFYILERSYFCLVNDYVLMEIC